jgi:ABC-2 type transport system permease protein
MKILKKNAPVMAIYFGIFILVSAMMMSNANTSVPGSFQNTKSPVVLFSEEDTPLVDGLKKALSDQAVFVTMEDDPQVLQDGLYYNRVSVILRIPKGFTESFLEGRDLMIETTAIPGSTTLTYIDMTVERYFQVARIYAALLPDLEQGEMVKQVLEDLSVEAPFTYQTTQGSQEVGSLVPFYFNYLSYTFMFVLIMGVSVLLLSLNQPVIKRRNACAPIPAGKANRQVFLAILVFAFIAWIILVAMSLLFAGKEAWRAHTLYYLVNSLLFATTTAGVSYLIASVIHGRESIVAVANIVTLGSCFISGVFVPQELLSKSVLQIASFLPTYWYVRGNRLISTLTQWSSPSSNGLRQAMLIQLGFAAAFFVVALVVGKRKRLSLEKN